MVSFFGLFGFFDGFLVVLGFFGLFGDFENFFGIFFLKFFFRKNLSKGLEWNKPKKKAGMIERMTQKASELVESILLPFSSPFNQNNAENRKNRKEKDIDMNNSLNILATRKPKRPPRFFFKSKYLIPYSSMKAKLQMTIDVRDIENGVKLQFPPKFPSKNFFSQNFFLLKNFFRLSSTSAKPMRF